MPGTFQRNPVFLFGSIMLALTLLLVFASQAQAGISLQVDVTVSATICTDEFSPTLTEGIQTPSATVPPTPEPVFVPIETETPPPSETVEVSPSLSETSTLLAASATPGEQALLLVQISSAATSKQLSRLTPFSVLDIGLSQLGIYAIRVPAEQSQQAMEALAALPYVNYVEPNYIAAAQDTVPNDPDFSLQYALANIHAPQAWQITTGSPAETIAIVDSGVDLTHPDLASKLLPGYDFVNGDSIPQDDNGHGTHVAGIAAAASNNGQGIAGVSWGARILPVKVLDTYNSGTYANVAAGIVWATDHGAQVINLSLGGSNPSLTLEAAVNYAAMHGVALAAAAGNTNGAVLYPAHYPAVIAVANTNAANQRASNSNYGPEVELAAPGIGIYSLEVGGGYIYMSGTSMSTPHVSGALALLLGLPGMSAGQARAILESSALDIDSPGWDIYTGAGLIQLDAALAVALPSPTSSVTVTLTAVSASAKAFRNTPTLPVLSFIEGGTAFTPTEQASLASSSSSIQLDKNPTMTPTPSVTLVFTPTFTITATPPGRLPAPTAPLLWMPCLGLTLILLGLLIIWSITNSKSKG